MMGDRVVTRDTLAARERLSALSEAILRINANLEVESVLREVVESTRAMTGARYGMIVLTDGHGEVQDFVTSGVGPEKHLVFLEWSDGPRLFAHLHGLSSPLRIPDLNDYIRSLGFSPFPIPIGSFQAMPMRHGNGNDGIFFLGEKPGEFTEADEEVLVLFASQAVTALANARAHQADQRTRTQLEALIETCPVGVAVLDAETNRPVSFNREARRIVSELQVPGISEVELSGMLTCRFADGREVTLGELGNAERVRSEEVELYLPDGRAVRTLLDVTPVRSADGTVDRVVAIMQDLAPFEALARARAEFMGMVSHELRSPLVAIKGAAAMVLGASREFDMEELIQFFRIVDEQANLMDALVGDLLDAGRIAAGTLPVMPESAEFAVLAEQARSAFQNAGGRQTVVVNLPTDLPRVMVDGRRIVQVLNNLLANAARHSPPDSQIRLAASLDGAHVAVSVTDEGEGMTPDRLANLFRRHVGVGESSGGGSGLGLVICKGLVEAHGGRIRAESDGPGKGMRVTFILPLAEESGEIATAQAGAPKPQRGQEGERILVVDDDPQILRQVRDTLSAAGYMPAVTGDPQEVAHLIEEGKPELVLLDLMLPSTDGFALMENIPAMADLPVIFISAYGRDETVARALEAGAADYIVKPFSPTELTARVRAALRRRKGPEPFVLGDLIIDHTRRRVSIAGQAVRLTVIEYELLHLLSVNSGRVLSYETLMGRLWGDKNGNNPERVRNFVRKLRSKLGDPATSPSYILNERGVGYRMPEPGDP